MFIKRIIGLPGEIIKIIDGRVLMKHSRISDFVEFEEEYLSEYNKGKTFLPLNVKETEFLIPEGKYFVMGDNRSNSSDSRSCFQSCSIEGSSHFLDQKDIVGKVIKF